MPPFSQQFDIYIWFMLICEAEKAVLAELSTEAYRHVSDGMGPRRQDSPKGNLGL